MSTTVALTAVATSVAMRRAPLASVGFISDIQCADLPNGQNYLKTETRYYRGAFAASERAIAAFRAARVQAVVHLGDLVDGFNAEHGLTDSVLARILAILPPVATQRVIPSLTMNHPQTSARDVIPFGCFHLIGNHELMNAPRGRWANVLGMGPLSRQSLAAIGNTKSQDSQATTPPRKYLFPKDATSVSDSYTGEPFTSAAPLYYDIEVANRFRLIMLDSYDISIMGYTDLKSKHPSQVAAEAFLAAENPNENKASPLNMTGNEQRKVTFNGGIGEVQMEWMRRVLDDCVAKSQVALVCSHVAFHSSAAHPSALIWNYQEVLDLVHEYRQVVIACLHGHDHDGGDFVDADGITHHTFEAILTSPDGRDAFGIMNFYENEIEFVGTDRMSSFKIPLPTKHSTSQHSTGKELASAAAPPDAAALVELGRALRSVGYSFTTITPASHARVVSRENHAWSRNLADIFGWSRKFRADALSPDLLALMQRAGIAQPLPDDDGWRPTLRVSSLYGLLYFHSAYPTTDNDAVFFGPDTYRFIRALESELTAMKAKGRTIRRATDVGAGGGPGALTIARQYPTAEVLALDINERAMHLCRANAQLACLANVTTQYSNLLTDVGGQFDLIVSNPPYLLDASERAYRHGGGELGIGLSLDLTIQSLDRLAPGGTLLLYTGVVMIHNHDPFLERLEPLLTKAGMEWHYEEIDPDVFGEELDMAAYSEADRIAAVWLKVTKPVKAM